jgi:hypothetical protein
MQNLSRFILTQAIALYLVGLSDIADHMQILKKQQIDHDEPNRP